MAQLTAQSVVMTVVAIAIGIVTIGSVLAPIASDVMSDLTKTVNGTAVYEDGATWASMIGIVVVVSILGLIIVAVNSYSKK